MLTCLTRRLHGLFWAKIKNNLICESGIINPWVYGFRFYVPRPVPANPMGMTFYPLADPRVEKLSQTRAEDAGGRRRAAARRGSEREGGRRAAGGRRGAGSRRWEWVVGPITWDLLERSTVRDGRNDRPQIQLPGIRVILNSPETWLRVTQGERKESKLK